MPTLHATTLGVGEDSVGIPLARLDPVVIRAAVAKLGVYELVDVAKGLPAYRLTIDRVLETKVEGCGCLLDPSELVVDEGM